MLLETEAGTSELDHWRLLVNMKFGKLWMEMND